MTSASSKMVDELQTSRAALANSRKRRTRLLSLVALGITLVVVMVFAAAIGSAHVPVSTVYKILVHKLPLLHVASDWAPSVETIVVNIRLPRVVLAALVGGSLGMAGAVYQGVFRNPLADPYLIGVAQGATLGAVLGFMAPVAIIGGSIGVIPIAAFAGALLAMAGVYMVGRVGNSLPITTTILGGVALGAFITAISSFFIQISGNRLHGIVSWLLGGFSLADWQQVKVLFPYVLVGMVTTSLFSRSLNVMQLDDDQAQQLGVNVERTKVILLGAATLVTAASVSFSGTIGFVGLIVPHAVRLIWGPDYRWLLPLSAIGGALFLVLADTIVRSLGLLSGVVTEVPVGIVTAFVGAPFFLYLLRQKKRSIF